MWVQTVFGFFSVVRKRGEPHLTIRARARRDLERLRDEHLPSLGEIRVGAGTDYRYRAEASHEAFGEALRSIAEGIDYHNFKDAVGARLGRARHDVYLDAWRVLARIEREDDEEGRG